VKIADLCDETLDPSGALLGFVRDAALAPIIVREAEKPDDEMEYDHRSGDDE